MSLLSHYVHVDDARIVYGYKCRYIWIDLEFVTQLIHRSVVIIIIIIKGIYIAQVRKGHKCAMSARWQYGYVTVYISMYHIHEVK